MLVFKEVCLKKKKNSVYEVLALPECYAELIGSYVTDVWEQPIGPILKGQAWLLDV